MDQQQRTTLASDDRMQLQTADIDIAACERVNETGGQVWRA